MLRATATVHLAALQHNLACVKKLAKGAAVQVMVKANAYGHGLLVVANALSQADAFGVATLEEALELRKNGIVKPIVLMAGFFDPEELPLILQHDLTIVIHEFYQLQMLEQARPNKPISIWLKVDSGMHRLGFPPHEIAALYSRLSQQPWIKKPFGWMTHLADADNPANNTTLAQLACFTNTVGHLPGAKSIANSAAIVSWPQTHADWVRPGIMLYGVSPLIDDMGSHLGLKPVMTLSTQLIAIHSLKCGDAVGYGGTWVCPQDMPVGVAAIGYGDGYPRHAQNGTPVLVNGYPCQLAGRVSMDMITIDLRNAPTAKIGDRVTLWGENLPIEYVARKAQTIPYELFCNLTSRVARCII